MQSQVFEDSDLKRSYASRFKIHLKSKGRASRADHAVPARQTSMGAGDCFRKTMQPSLQGTIFFAMRCLQEIHNAARVILIPRRRLRDADNDGELHATMPEKCRATLHQKIVWALLCCAGARQREARCRAQCADAGVWQKDHDAKKCSEIHEQISKNNAARGVRLPLRLNGMRSSASCCHHFSNMNFEEDDAVPPQEKAL